MHRITRSAVLILALAAGHAGASAAHPAAERSLVPASASASSAEASRA